MFENLRKDLKTYSGDWSLQGFWVMIVYRFGQWRYTVRPPLLRKPFSLLYKILYKFIQVITGVELPCEVKLGKNFRIDHFGGIEGIARQQILLGAGRADDEGPDRRAPVTGYDADPHVRIRDRRRVGHEDRVA